MVNFGLTTGIFLSISLFNDTKDNQDMKICISRFFAQITKCQFCKVSISGGGVYGGFIVFPLFT